MLKPKNKYSEAQKLQILEHYERYSPDGHQGDVRREPGHTGPMGEGENQAPPRKRVWQKARFRRPWTSEAG